MSSRGKPGPWYVWTNPGLLGWTLLTLLASPIAITRKIRRRRFPYEFDPRRWFIKRIQRTANVEAGPCIAFVAASYGELLLVKLVANELAREYPHACIIYCVRDEVTLEHVREKEAGREAAIWPFDFIYPVARWLNIYQPDLLVFSERFRFTVFSRAAKAYGCKVALINGRTRERRSVFYSLALPFYRWIFNAFDAMCFQNLAYLNAAKPFATSTKLVAAGDLKIDLKPKPLSEEREAELRSWLAFAQSKPMLAAGSTDYRVEDEFVLKAYKSVREQTDCRLLLAPRLLERLPEILGTIEAADLTYSCRTSDKKDADVFILDTLGELTHAYKNCVAAYVGGALVGNGHNIVEPLQWGVPVSYGMNRGYFENMQLLAEEAGVGTRVATPEDLTKFYLESLNNPAQKEGIAQRAKEMLEPHRGALERTVDTLSELLR